MKHHKYYTTSQKEKIVGLISLIAIIVVITIALTVSFCKGEDALVKCWVMCKPGNYVHVRWVPDKKGQEVGYLDAGDWFLTDGTSSNGFIRCYDIGEYGEGWVYCGYVVTEEPEAVMENYVCCAPNRVACRRWMGGPKIDGAAWMVNLSECTVYYIADGWACTSKGYIKAEYLEASQK